MAFVAVTAVACCAPGQRSGPPAVGSAPCHSGLSYIRWLWLWLPCGGASSGRIADAVVTAKLDWVLPVSGEGQGVWLWYGVDAAPMLSWQSQTGCCLLRGESVGVWIVWAVRKCGLWRNVERELRELKPRQPVRPLTSNCARGHALESYVCMCYT